MRPSRCSSEAPTRRRATAATSIPAVTGVVGPPDPDSPLVTLYAKKSFPPGLNTARYEGVEDLLAKAGAASGDVERAAAYKAILQKTMTRRAGDPALRRPALHCAHRSRSKASFRIHCSQSIPTRSRSRDRSVLGYLGRCLVSAGRYGDRDRHRRILPDAGDSWRPGRLHAR